mgnify:FL=1
MKIGIYITNAVKTPKKEYTIDKSSIKNSLPYLEEEISLFKNIKDDNKYDALYYAREYGKNEEIIKLLTR